MDNDHLLSIYIECAKGLMSRVEKSKNFRFYGSRRKSVTIDNAL